ncbi:MAG: hypothetical protein HUU02_03675 [Bacteroidetes bacterium]|nr:hypothetical protein [Bacteroidota bacterium]
MDPDIVIPVFLFGGTAVVLWKFLDDRHRERMIIIEKGLVKEDLKYLYAAGSRPAHPLSSLKYGMLAAFIGMGILVSAFLSRVFWDSAEQVTAGIIFLSAGLGLITYYSIAKKRLEEERLALAVKE